MTQRNSLQSADIPQRADAFAANAEHRAFMNTDTASARGSAPLGRTRRATRIAASLSVEVRDQFGMREETRTQFLLIRGAVLATTSKIRVGHKLTIRNLKNGRNAECHVIAVESAVKEVHQVEIEFTRPQPDFWPVQFPADEVKANEASVAEPTTSVHSETSKTSLFNLEPESPKMEKHDDQLVVLADSVSQDFPRTAGFHQERYTAKTAPLDSVAQFRAANRAAHRRQQQMKVFYSVLSLATLAGAALGYRDWSNRHPAEEARAAIVPVVQNAAATTPVRFKAPAEIQTTPPAVQAPTRESATVGQALTATAPLVQPTPSQPEARPEDTQVEVRHSATLHKAVEAEEEAPMALPLRAGNDSVEPKPEMLNSVVAQVPSKNAMLALQPPKKAVPAKLLHSVQAQYPAMARQIRAEGEVLLDVEVDAAGNVSSAKALSGPPVLRAAAVDAVRHWKYQPATIGDKPVASRDSVKIDFHLH
jgi:TonB family protein